MKSNNKKVIIFDETGISGDISVQTEGSTEESIWTSHTQVANFAGECSEIVN